MATPTVVKFIANQGFQYNDKRVLTGEEWVPNGGRWDNQIKESRLVRRIEEPVSAEDYSVYSNAELREKLTDRGLPVYGKKSDLIQRLQEDDVRKVTDGE